MKLLHLFLIYAIIGYCFTDEEIIDCGAMFETSLIEKCEAIGSCTYNSKDKKCIETGQCSSGNRKTSAECSEIVPKNFTFYKCELINSECKETLRECGDFHLISSGPISGDICSQLKAPEGKHCVLKGYCDAHYDECESITTTTEPSSTSTVCTNNIPKDPSKECYWNTDDPAHPICKYRYRDCGVTFYDENIDTCTKLNASNNKKKCIFDEVYNYCKEEFIKCEDLTLTSDNCETHFPLNDDNDGYNLTMKCVLDESRSSSANSEYRCKAAKRQCNDYNSPSIPNSLKLQGIKFDEEFCKQLNVTNSNYQRCAFDKSKGCYEEFKTCEDYTNHKIETNRECENIVLLTPNQKCFYDNKEDKCITREIYSNCSEYMGKDKKTCESILSNGNQQYCILDKDTQCIEKPINCSEAYNQDDCLNIAKAGDINKRCAYKGSKCVEEYIRCEDYPGTSSSECESIQLYDGKTCKWMSTSTGTSITNNHCISQFKTCEDAKTEEECKLIEKTGVDDPERKVCDWIGSGSNPCNVNYKYCSDYRGTDNVTCEKIKPYDESGNNIDVGFKCYYEPNVGCQKVPLECKDAGSNAVLCELYSEYIKDKDKKHCVLDGIDSSNQPLCRAHYKECKYYESEGDLNSCEENIIQGYIRGVCENNNGVCEQKRDCSSKFTSPTSTLVLTDPPNSIGIYYKGLCEKNSYKCEYDLNSGKCTNKEIDCGSIKFYNNDTNNKDICEKMEVTEPYKKCVLKEDFSGCKQEYRELNYSTGYNSYLTPPDASTQGNSSNYIRKGIHLIIVLLCLLF